MIKLLKRLWNHIISYPDYSKVNYNYKFNKEGVWDIDRGIKIYKDPQLGKYHDINKDMYIDYPYLAEHFNSSCLCLDIVSAISFALRGKIER